MTDTLPADPAWEARLLLREARVGTLATQRDGQPFTGLITPALAENGDILLLLSDLSAHTRQLRADGRCSILVVGAPPEPNPQTAPRVSVMGVAGIETDVGLRARYLAIHPYARLYADFGDFNLWRMRVESAQFVGGFARAFRLDGSQLAPDASAVAALGAAARGIVAHCNSDHPDAMAVLADNPSARMVALDVDGCDLEIGGATRRVAWSRPVASPDEVRRELILLTRAARTRAAAVPISAP